MDSLGPCFISFFPEVGAHSSHTKVWWCWGGLMGNMDWIGLLFMHLAFSLLLCKGLALRRDFNLRWTATQLLFSPSLYIYLLASGPPFQTLLSLAWFCDNKIHDSPFSHTVVFCIYKNWGDPPKTFSGVCVWKKQLVLMFLQIINTVFYFTENIFLLGIYTRRNKFVF